MATACGCLTRIPKALAKSIENKKFTDLRWTIKCCRCGLTCGCVDCGGCLAKSIRKMMKQRRYCGQCLWEIDMIKFDCVSLICAKKE